MEVLVKLYATLQRGRFAEKAVELPSVAIMSDLLNRLDISPDDVSILMVNGRDASFKQELHQGDSITLIPPIGGG